MAVKSLKLYLSDAAPFNQHGSWFETFVGEKLIPIIDRGLFRRFWFSRYGAVGNNKHVQFRFELDDPADVQADIDSILREFEYVENRYDDYNVTQDLGRSEGSRLMGMNSRHQDYATRGNIAFDFLHASAKLFVHCLTGPDADGQWHLEPEQASTFNVETSMEQFHHFFCNMTGVPTYVAVATHPEAPGGLIVSLINAASMQGRDNAWTIQAKFRVHF